MGSEIIFVPSAFNHDISEENIRWVLLNHLADGIIEEDNETKYIAIGFDKIGRLLEVMYNEIDDQKIKVFHAMPCRKQYFDMLEAGGYYG